MLHLPPSSFHVELSAHLGTCCLPGNFVFKGNNRNGTCWNQSAPKEETYGQQTWYKELFQNVLFKLLKESKDKSPCLFRNLFFHVICSQNNQIKQKSPIKNSSFSTTYEQHSIKSDLCQLEAWPRRVQPSLESLHSDAKFPAKLTVYIDSEQQAGRKVTRRASPWQVCRNAGEREM